MSLRSNNKLRLEDELRLHEPSRQLTSPVKKEIIQFDNDMKKMLPVDSNKNLLSLDELFKDTDKGDGTN
jgi:hypothetical protein